MQFPSPSLLLKNYLAQVKSAQTPASVAQALHSSAQFHLSFSSMATTPKNMVLLFLAFAAFLSYCSGAHAQVEEAAAGGLKMMMNSVEWPASMSMYSSLEGSNDFDDGLEGFDRDIVEGTDEMGDRRSLFWGKPVHYYISYGALSANRIPCPPRSGRSYYTHSCFKSRAPVNPYSRGCSRITRCRR